MQDTTSLNNMQKAIREFCEARDWDQFHTPKDMALSLMLEAAEVLEHFQWKNDDEVAKYLEEHKDDVGEELSDVMYWVLRMADRFDVDLKATFDRKMAKNEAKYPVDKARGNHKKYTEHAE